MQVRRVPRAGPAAAAHIPQRFPRTDRPLPSQRADERDARQYRHGRRRASAGGIRRVAVDPPWTTRRGRCWDGTGAV